MEAADQTNHFYTTLLLNDINYGVILSFMDRFGKILALKEFIFDDFESSIVNQNQSKDKIKLLEKTFF